MSERDRHGPNWTERGVIANTRARRRITGEVDPVVELTEEEMARQDREAETLREAAEAPLYDIWTSPFADDEDTRRRLLARAGIPGPRPKDRLEPWEVLSPEEREQRWMIRRAYRLSPNYGDEGPTR